MSRFAPLLVIPVMLLAAGCDGFAWKKEVKPVRPAAEVWAERVAQTSVGMPRMDVEALLPPNRSAPTQRRLKGETQLITYWLDDQWKVTLEYDFTGIEQAEAGKTGFDSPHNKLQSTPVLERQYL